MDVAETSSKVEAWYADATTVNPPKGERFAAVEFSAENGLIAEVPVTWLRGKRIGVYLSKKAVVGKCYWPPKLLEKKVRKLAENLVQPDKTTWELYDIVVLNYGGTFADVVEATKAISGKESEADNSDSSVEEPLAARRERAEKHRKRRSSPMSGGSDSGCDELDTSHLNMNEGSKSDQGAEHTPSQSSSQVEKAGSSKSGKSPLKTPRKTPTKSVTITTPGKTPQKQGDSKKTTPKKTPQKQGVSDNSEGHTRHEVGPFATAMLPFKRSLPMFTQSPSKKANLSKTTFSSAFPISRPLTLSTEAPKKQKQMTSYVSSISEKEASILQDELDSMELSQNIFESPCSNRSASPAASDASEGPFKTPREKSAYRSLAFSSPSDGAGMRVIVRTLGELQEQLMKMEKLHKDSAESVAKTMAKILSCVQPAIETNIAEDIPRLPLSEKDNEDKLNKMLMSTDQFNKVVTFLHGLGGSNPRDAVYNVMKTVFTDAFASTKSMKGIKRTNHPAKDAFMGTQLFKAVMCAVRRRFRDTSVSEVIELTGNWLKDAPSREKKRQRRKEAREELLREYEDTDVST